jgi:hypothetical protein
MLMHTNNHLSITQHQPKASTKLNLRNNFLSNLSIKY